MSSIFASLTKAGRKYLQGEDVSGVTKLPELINNEAIQAINAAGTGVVDLIKANASDQVVLPNGVSFDGGTASATAGAATLNKKAGKITSEALTTAAGAAYTLTLTDSLIAAAAIVLVSVANGTNTQGIPRVGLVTPGAGSATIEVYNDHASQALNGTIVISFAVIDQ